MVTGVTKPIVKICDGFLYSAALPAGSKRAKSASQAWCFRWDGSPCDALHAAFGISKVPSFPQTTTPAGSHANCAVSVMKYPVPPQTRLFNACIRVCIGSIRPDSRRTIQHANGLIGQSVDHPGSMRPTLSDSFCPGFFKFSITADSHLCNRRKANNPCLAPAHCSAAQR